MTGVLWCDFHEVEVVRGDCFVIGFLVVISRWRCCCGYLRVLQAAVVADK